MLRKKNIYSCNQKDLKLLLTKISDRRSFKKSVKKFIVTFFQLYFFFCLEKIYSGVTLSSSFPTISSLLRLIKYLKSYQGW